MRHICRKYRESGSRNTGLPVFQFPICIDTVHRCFFMAFVMGGRVRGVSFDPFNALSN